MLAWLTDAGSLVQRLQTYGAEQPAVTVLKEAWAIPLLDEAESLAIPVPETALIREILLGEKAHSYVFARTVFPRETLTDEESELGQLGTRTLGSILFKNPLLERSPFEIACFQPGTPWHSHVNEHYPVLDQLWARRSIFSIKQKPMMVTEVFLPSLLSLYQKMAT
jgi:chorismate--pyruvate lyase